jgi:hypothetical protein
VGSQLKHDFIAGIKFALELSGRDPQAVPVHAPVANDAQVHAFDPEVLAHPWAADVPEGPPLLEWYRDKYPEAGACEHFNCLKPVDECDLSDVASCLWLLDREGRDTKCRYIAAAPKKPRGSGEACVVPGRTE